MQYGILADNGFVSGIQATDNDKYSTSNDHVEGIPNIYIHGIQANKGSVMTM